MSFPIKPKLSQQPQATMISWKPKIAEELEKETNSLSEESMFTPVENNHINSNQARAAKSYARARAWGNGNPLAAGYTPPENNIEEICTCDTEEMMPYETSDHCNFNQKNTAPQTTSVSWQKKRQFRRF